VPFPAFSLLTIPSVVIPSLIIASVNAWRLWDEHWEHKKHDVPLEEKVEYPYQNIRTKNFFWGDGDKVGSRLGLLGCGFGGSADVFGRHFSGTPRSITTRRTRSRGNMGGVQGRYCLSLEAHAAFDV
jgi:hypothetical protein